MTLKRELEVAVSAVRAAALTCREVQRRLVSADTLTKKDKSPVTVADFAAQAIVCRLLEISFPQDPVVGEESGHELRAHEAMLDQVVTHVAASFPGCSRDDVVRWIDRGVGTGKDGRFWTLDPVDGTKGFLRGEQYAIALALIVDGKVVLGVLGCPNLSSAGSEGTLYFARRTNGAEMMPLSTGLRARVQVSSQSDSRRIRIVESVEAAHGDHIAHQRIKERLQIAAESVRLDSQAKYAVLARGDAEAYLRLPTRADYRENIWDQAAGSIVIEEAGGRVTDAFGRALDFSCGKKLEANQGIVASNGLVHGALIEAIAATQP